jgi:hypothetical protein
MKVLKEMNDEKKFAKVVFTCPATDKYLFTLARNRGGGRIYVIWTHSSFFQCLNEICYDINGYRHTF